MRTKAPTQRLRDITPEQCGLMHCAPSYSFGPAVRGYWLIHYILSGRGSFTNDRGTHEVRAGDIFIIRPGEVTFYEADAETPWSYSWAGFHTELELPRVLYSSDVLHVPFLEEIFRTLPEYADLSRAGAPELFTGQIYCLLGMLRQRLGVGAPDAERHIRAAVSIMEREYQRGIDVSEIAERLHLNRSYFTKLFTTVMKCSPGDYLYEIRMARAAELLARPEYSVGVVAASVGYSDPFVFSRAFRRRFGCSPREYLRGSSDKPKNK
ncbi:MAG: AraC family transcriptional regulator [Clostridia bacterium]|nr:AraC family transcriptional regulator [Clostridia bacterium]